MANALAHAELVLLCLLTLVLALQPGLPMPRWWAGIALALVFVQTAAVRGMRLRPVQDQEVTSATLVSDLSEAIALIAVPTATAALLVVIFWHLARACAQLQARNETSPPSAATSPRAGEARPAPPG